MTKKQARRKVRTALKYGRLKKSPCYCGRADSQAHHPDHSIQVSRIIHRERWANV